MKKYLSVFLMMLVVPFAAMAETDTPVFDDRVPLSEKLWRQYKTESPNVIYRDRNKGVRVGKFYGGLNADLSFLTWKNKYSWTEYGEDMSATDKFNFKPVFGIDLSAGYRIDERWRVDGEIGYVGKYYESETENPFDYPTEKTEFNLETFYITANAYYDIIYGFYAGLGGGLAIAHISADHSQVDDGSATNLSPMGAVMLGWTYMLDEKIDFDFKYRLSFYDGGDMSIGGVKVDTGLIMNNSLSAGIRYHF